MKKVLILIGLLVTVGLVAAHFLLPREPLFSGIVRVSGNIEVTQVPLGFQVGGRVTERLVTEGETVRKGDLVARLDDRELAREAALREAQVASARAVLAELEHGSRPEEIREGEERLRQARADAERLSADARRFRELQARGVVSTRDWDAVRTAYEAAAARVREAEEALALLRIGPRIERIERARAELRQAEEALALARVRLSHAVLAAPLSALVLSKNIEPGEVVAPGTPVVTLGDMGDCWLRAYIDETDLGRVKVGQRVRLTTDTFPGKTYEGRVTFVSGEAEFTPRTIQTQKERVKLVYRVKITVANPEMELKPGMPADAEILVGGNP